MTIYPIESFVSRGKRITIFSIYKWFPIKKDKEEHYYIFNRKRIYLLRFIPIKDNSNISEWMKNNSFSHLLWNREIKANNLFDRLLSCFSGLLLEKDKNKVRHIYFIQKDLPTFKIRRS